MDSWRRRGRLGAVDGGSGASAVGVGATGVASRTPPTLGRLTCTAVPGRAVGGAVSGAGGTAAPAVVARAVAGRRRSPFALGDAGGVSSESVGFARLIGCTRAKERREWCRGDGRGGHALSSSLRCMGKLRW